MERYDVYLYNLPKVKDGEAVPVPPHRTADFADLGEAKKFAEEHRTQFDRVVVMKTADAQQSMVERYIDGTREVREPAKAAADA